MNSGIYYLYEYKKEEQLRNAGFIRITTCFQTYCLQIHAQTLSFTTEKPVHLYALFQEGEISYCSNLVELPVHDSTICTHLKISDCDFPNQKRFPELTGFLLSDGQSHYAVLEEGYSLNMDTLTLWEENTPTEKTPPTPSTVNESPAVAKEASPIAKETSSQRKIQKIQRKDLCCLPKQYWSLANNSFLMHGCRNYKHLLLIEENGRLQLGIPGLYSPEEAKAAQFFGFPLFIQSYLNEIELSEHEKEQEDSFGYWCRFL